MAVWLGLGIRNNQYVPLIAIEESGVIKVSMWSQTKIESPNDNLGFRLGL